MATATKPQQRVIEHNIKLVPGQERLLLDFTSPILAAIAGCVAGGTLIDTPTGSHPIEKLLGFGNVLAITHKGIQSVPAFIFRKGIAQLYSLTLDNGQSIEATADHYLLVSDGQTLLWHSVGELSPMLSGQNGVCVVSVKPVRAVEPQHEGYLLALRESNLAPCQSGLLLDALHYWDKVLDYPGHYSEGFHLDAPRLLEEVDSDRELSPLLIGAHGYNQKRLRKDDQDTLQGYISLCQSFGHLSRSSLTPLLAREISGECYASPLPCVSSQGHGREPWLNHKLTSVAQSPSALNGLFQPESSSYGVFSSLSSQSLLSHTLNKITSIKPTTIASYYDMVVPDYHNYLAQGMVHHNTGAGKTILGYWWLHSRMSAYPGNTWLVIEPTYNMLAKVLLESSDPERPSLRTFLSMIGLHPDYHAVDRILYCDLGKLYLGSADNPDSMQGTAVKGAWLDEAGQMALLAHETASQRCSMLRGQELLTTTPYNMGWLLTQIKNLSGKLGIHVETWRSIDRPGFPRESYELARQLLPPWRFAMIYDAQFERPAGVIYSNFNETTCIVDRFPIPAHWTVHIGQDFGSDNPAALFYAQDPLSGDLFLFAEYLPGAGISVFDRVKEMTKLIVSPTGKPYNVLHRVGGNPQEEEARHAYGAHGWTLVGPHPMLEHVEPQITHVFGFHQLNKIKVFRDMTHYLDEKRTFARKLDAQNQPAAEINEPARFHLMSCERYLMSWFRPETVVKSQPSKARAYSTRR